MEQLHGRGPVTGEADCNVLAVVQQPTELMLGGEAKSLAGLHACSVEAHVVDVSGAHSSLAKNPVLPEMVRSLLWLNFMYF